MSAASRVILCALGASLLSAQDPAPSPPIPAAQVFQRLTGLVGEWTGETAIHRIFRVTYRLIANGTVLTEHWVMSPTRESMTVYHMDGAVLLATHYCPQGNQPRLSYAPRSGTDAFHFTFVGATNLPDPAQSHQHAMWIRIEGKDAFTRSETYLEKGQSDTETMTFHRASATLLDK
jgi:hypothetical protein